MRIIRYIKKGARIPGLWKRAVALLMCLVLSVSLAPYVGAGYVMRNGKWINDPEVPDDQTFVEACAVENTYVLRVDTGVNSGSNVLFFGLRYEDSNGVGRTEYVFPHENSLSEGYVSVSGMKSPDDRLDTVKDVTGYSVKETFRDMEGLAPYSTDYYILRPHYTIDNFIGIDVFMRYPSETKSSKGWTCNGMYVYSADHIYGVGMLGYYSDDYYLDFDGTLISKLVSQEGTVEFDLNKSDTIFRLGRDEDMGYTIENVNESYSNHAASDYLFKMDLADVYGAGIEALCAEVSDGGFITEIAEAATLMLTYEDIYGEKRYTYLPMVTSMVCWAVENGLLDKSLDIVGVAQQGESIIFPASLPDFAKIDDLTVIYGDGAATAAGITAPGSNEGEEATEGRRFERVKALANDFCSMTGFTIYDNSVRVKGTKGGAQLDIEIESGDPILFYTSRSENGEEIRAGNFNVGKLLRQYVSGAALKPSSGANNFMVVIQTDSAMSAATTDDIQLQIGYLSTDGTVKSTDSISLKDAAKHMNGYWPIDTSESTKNFTDASYIASMASGGTLMFALQLSEVTRFTSATFIMDSRATDDWQMSDFKIYDCNEIGKRVAEWKNVTYSDRVYYRDFDDNPHNCVAWYPNGEQYSKDDPEGSMAKIYLNGSQNKKTIYFSESGGRSVIEDPSENEDYGGTTVDWNDLRYSMTFRETQQDLGFSKAAATYEVNVKVANNDNANAQEGDCGSDNLFYFKLIFEGGSSGYVLANQQLTADGFRAGRTETFTVVTNENFGELSSVSIVPEVDSDSVNQDIFDKLNIDSISVVKKTSNGTAKTWNIDNVGWIDIDYVEKGAEQSTSGRPGKTEGEVARNYLVNTSGYSMNLLFTMTTGSYDKSATDVGYTPGAKNPTYAGSVIATIEYYDSNRMLRKTSIDVVRAMYDYAERKANYYTGTYAQDDGSTLQKAKSDTTFMMREGHVDRFIVTLADVSAIVRIRFGMSSEVSTTWNLENVSVWEITSNGTLQISANDEYKRTNKTEKICSSTSETGYSLKVFAPDRASDELGEEQTLTVSFEDHNIELREDGNKWTSVIERTPKNLNDTVNVYVYMKEDSSATAVGKYDLIGALQYHNGEDGTDRQLSMNTMQADKDRGMYYALGMKVPGMDIIQNLVLQADSRESIYCPADHAVIQHIRSGVVVGTYYIKYGGKDTGGITAAEGVVQKISGEQSQDKQVVRLFFSSDIEKSLDLMPETNDIAVAIRYKTVNDSDDVYYSSSYKFVSADITEKADNGEQIPVYTAVNPGMIVEVPFNEAYVSEIVGVTIAATGGVNVDLDSAYVATYQVPGDKLTGWYNFADGITVTNTPQTFQKTDETVVPVTMTFRTQKTAEILSSDADSGTDAPIRMTIVYTDSISNLRTEMEIQDIREYLVDGSFKGSESEFGTATIRFFMKDVGNIRSVILEPYTKNAYGSAIWGLYDVYCETEVNGVSHPHRTKIDTDIMMESPKFVNLSTVVAGLEASYFNENSGVLVKRQTEPNGTTEIKMDSGTTLDIIPNIIGQLDEYGYTVNVTVKGYGEILGDNYCVIEKAENEEDSDVVRFTPPENITGETIIYVVTIASEEMPEVSAAIEVSVASKPVPVPELGGDSTETGGENTESGGENTESGGENTESGGDSTGTGGDSTGIGGDSTETGGDSTGTGGESTETGGESTETGGENTESGSENDEFAGV